MSIIWGWWPGRIQPTTDERWKELVARANREIEQYEAELALEAALDVDPDDAAATDAGGGEEEWPHRSQPDGPRAPERP